jgi:hypothetical protein
MALRDRPAERSARARSMARRYSSRCHRETEAERWVSCSIGGSGLHRDAQGRAARSATGRCGPRCRKHSRSSQLGARDDQGGPCGRNPHCCRPRSLAQGGAGCFRECTRLPRPGWMHVSSRCAARGRAPSGAGPSGHRSALATRLPTESADDVAPSPPPSSRRRPRRPVPGPSCSAAPSAPTSSTVRAVLALGASSPSSSAPPPPGPSSST